MSTNNIETLRTHLFNTLEALADPKKPMDIERAKAVCQVGQVIINSAMVEVKFMQEMGVNKSDFINGSTQPTLPNGITNITQHRIK